MDTDVDVAVIGAGAMGAATAWHAARLGARRVLLVDRGQVCAGTSALGVGLVSRLVTEPHDVGLVERSAKWLGSLDEQAGGSFDYHETGSLLILGPAQEERIQRWLRIWRAQAVDVRPLGPDRISEIPGCEGLALADSEHAIFAQADGWCVTTDAVRAMVDRAREHGAQVRTGTEVQRVEDGCLHLDDGETIEAGAVVIAAGVHSRQLVPTGWDWRPPIDAYRPQAAVLEHEGADAGPVVHDAVEGTYWRAEGSGRVMIGDGTDLSSHDPDQLVSADRSFASLVAEKLAKRWPATDRAREVRSWAGLEAATPDARPLVGPVPGRQAVYLCTGGNGFGFMRAPALGEALAHEILGKGAPIALQGCRPDRFGAGHPGSFAMQEGFSLD